MQYYNKNNILLQNQAEGNNLMAKINRNPQLSRIRFAREIHFWAFILLALSLLTACNQYQAHVQKTTQSQTSTPITATITQSISPRIPVKSSTPLAPTRTITPIPYNSPTVTATATQTPPPPIIPSHYDLPDWFSNLQHYAFMMISNVTSNSNRISIVDADLSTQYDISIPYPDIYGYFWIAQGISFGFLASDFQTVYLVNALTGNVTIHTLHAKDINCLKEDAKQRDEYVDLVFAVSLGIASNSSPESAEFLCSEQVEMYHNHLITKRLGNIIMVTFNRGSLAGQSRILHIVDPGDELDVMGDYPFYDPDTGKAILVILKAEFFPETDEEKALYLRLGVHASRIEIYNVLEEKKIASFDGDIDPDSILIDPNYRQIILNAAITNKSDIPCFIDLGNGQLKCLDSLNTQEDFLRTDLLHTSRDGKRLIFAETNSARSDLCIYQIPSDILYCPTDKMEELHNLNIERYRISQDERFILFSYGSSCSHCDFWGDPSSAVIVMDGNNLYLLGKEVFVDHSPSYPFETILARP